MTCTARVAAFVPFGSRPWQTWINDDQGPGTLGFLKLPNGESWGYFGIYKIGIHNWDIKPTRNLGTFWDATNHANGFLNMALGKLH